jgi:hypothetical protein
MSDAREGGGTREVVRAIAEAPFGKAAIAILALGMTAFALSRLTLALLDPGRAGWRRRALHLAAAALNAALVVFLVHLVFGVESAAAEGPTRLARTLARPRGRWVVAAFAAGLLVRGVQRVVRPRGDDLPARVESVGLTDAASRWVVAIGSAAGMARGTILLAAGGGLAYAAAVRSTASGAPWIGAVLGCCLLVLAANEWTRVRYPLPERARVGTVAQPDTLLAAAAISPPAERTSPTPPGAPGYRDRPRSPRSDPSGPAPSE